MHRFIEYISDLLFLHDCVIIPDFGGFICNYKSAYIDEMSGVICPPSKDILFNRNLTHNDGLLVNWIACKEHITYEKATSQLMLFCEDLKIRLNQRQRIIFGDIGVFFTDRRFNIIFEAGKHNFFAETFGMEPLEISHTAFIGTTDPLLAGKTPQVKRSDMPRYIDIESSGNILHRLLKYALGATAIAGIVVMTQLNVFHPDENAHHDINNSTVQPVISNIAASTSEKTTCQKVISPAYDYVTYDPIEDLEW